MRSAKIRQIHAAKQDLYRLMAENGFDRMGVLSHRRQSDLVRQRAVLAKALRAVGYSYPVIGSAMERDHASIMNLCKRP